MRVRNDQSPDESSAPFAELLRMQTDFQARLADETFRYLRRLHGTLGPGSPGTVVVPREGLVLEGASARAGDAVELSIDIENVQRVHCIVSPQLTPLVGAKGTTWFPATSPQHPMLLIPPKQSERLTLRIDVPADLPGDEYGGALVLQGFRDGAIAVRVRVGGTPEPPPPPARKKSTTKRARGGKKS